MPACGKYCGPKPKAPAAPKQKNADLSGFTTPRARPKPAKSGKAVNPKAPNSKVGVY